MLKCVGKVGSQQLEQQHQRHDAEQRAEQGAGPAQQRHDQHLERDHRIEGDRRIDVGPARRHDRAGQRHERGADARTRRPLRRVVSMPV